MIFKVILKECGLSYGLVIVLNLPRQVEIKYGYLMHQRGRN